MRLGASIFLTLPLLAATATAAIPPQAESFDAFYNLDYDKAVALFEKAAQANPNSPDVWNHLAQGILYRRFFLAGALQSELLGKSNSFLRRPNVYMPPDEERRFLDANNRAMQISTERLAKNANDREALYALGIAHAHRGSFKFLCEKSYFAALRDATRSRNLHSRLLHVQPDHPDAILIPAMHDYISGSLPAMVRIFASMAGFSGNRQRGIATMERAVKVAQRTAVESRVLLSVIYNREETPQKAIPLMTELSAAFPRNYLYRSESILLLARAHRKQDALNAMAALEAMKQSNAPELALMDAQKVKRLRELVEKHLSDVQ